MFIINYGINKTLCKGQSIQDAILKVNARKIVNKKENLIIDIIRKIDPDFACKLKNQLALHSNEIKDRLEIRNYEDDPADYYFFDNKPILMILPEESDIRNIRDKDGRGVSMEMSFKYKILYNEKE